MFRDVIHPYDNLYEFYMSCEDADVYICCKDDKGRETVFATGIFAQMLDCKLLKCKKLNKV
jgi:hypothetical protein